MAERPFKHNGKQYKVTAFYGTVTVRVQRPSRAPGPPGRMVWSLVCQGRLIESEPKFKGGPKQVDWHTTEEYLPVHSTLKMLVTTHLGEMVRQADAEMARRANVRLYGEHYA